MTTYAQVQGAIFNAQPIPYAGGQNLLKGEKSPYAIPCVCDFTATGIPASGYVIDPSRFYNNGTIKTIQSIFLDNSANGGFAYVAIPAFNQVFALPPGWQGYFAILAPQLSGGVMTVTSPNATGIVNVLLLNSYFATQVWAASVIPAAPGVTLPVSDAILDATVVGGKQQVQDAALEALIVAARFNVRTQAAQFTYTDRSGVATGATQVLMPANAARQGFLVQNIDYNYPTEALWLNVVGGAAVVGSGAGLAAAGSIGFPGGSFQGVGSGAINLIAATAGHKFFAVEW